MFRSTRELVGMNRGSISSKSSGHRRSCSCCRFAIKVCLCSCCNVLDCLVFLKEFWVFPSNSIIDLCDWFRFVSFRFGCFDGLSSWIVSSMTLRFHRIPCHCIELHRIASHRIALPCPALPCIALTPFHPIPSHPIPSHPIPSTDQQLSILHTARENPRARNETSYSISIFVGNDQHGERQHPVQGRRPDPRL